MDRQARTRGPADRPPVTIRGREPGPRPAIKDRAAGRPPTARAQADPPPMAADPADRAQDPPPAARDGAADRRPGIIRGITARLTPAIRDPLEVRPGIRETRTAIRDRATAREPAIRGRARVATTADREPMARDSKEVPRGTIRARAQALPTAAPARAVRSPPVLLPARGSRPGIRVDRAIRRGDPARTALRAIRLTSPASRRTPPAAATGPAPTDRRRAIRPFQPRPVDPPSPGAAA